MERYREDQYGSVYEYSKDEDAYLFVGKKIGDETMQDVIDRILLECGGEQAEELEQ